MDKERREREAQRILDSPVFQEAVERAEQQTVKEWRAAETQEEREQLHGRINGIPVIQRQLRVLAGDKAWEKEGL